MRRQRMIPATVIGCALLLAFVAGASRTSADDKAAAKKVRVGLVNTLFRDDPEKQVQSMAGPLKSLMQEQAGVEGDVAIGGDALNLAAQLKEGKVQLGVFNGFEFAWAREKYPELKPLLIAVDRQPFVRAALVVRQDNKADSPTALQGKILAIPLLAREHCRIFAERRLVGEGKTMDKWFAKVATPRTAQDALDDLAENYVQAAVVDDVELEAFRKRFPKTAAKLRVLKESERFPCGVIAYRPGGVNEDTLKSLREGMIVANSNERGRKLLDLSRITGFEEIPADYEKNLADILKAYPAPTK